MKFTNKRFACPHKEALVEMGAMDPAAALDAMRFDVEWEPGDAEALKRKVEEEDTGKVQRIYKDRRKCQDYTPFAPPETEPRRAMPGWLEGVLFLLALVLLLGLAEAIANV